MKLRPLTLKDRTLFNGYLRKEPRSLSNYSFENVFIWRSLFEINWAIINEKFCLFFRDKMGCFMNLPPLGGLDRQTLKEVFHIMEDINHNAEISRIENIEEGDLAFFSAKDGSLPGRQAGAFGGQDSNFRVYEKAKEYIVSQNEMASLIGEKFKHKRNLYNFFKKNTFAIFRDYKTKEKSKISKLYRGWMKERMSKNSDSIYQAMLKDSFEAFGQLLGHFQDLNMQAKIVEIDGKIKGFTCGFPLSQDLFCINFEITDLKIKGLAQFIFCEFSKALKDFSEINIMDDSGIAGIRETKLSYRPKRLVPSYTALLKV